MSNNIFSPMEYYKSYPNRVIARPGYPARAAFKSTLMFNKYGKKILHDIRSIKTYADIGGCFGFGANSMKFQITRDQEVEPEVSVFEISSDFVKIGEMLFPYIEFVNGEFDRVSDLSNRYDMVTIFDVLEHIVHPELFLRSVSERCKYAMIITPLETSGEWRGNKPPTKQGDQHDDGHINFFSKSSYEDMIKTNGFDIISANMTHSIVPFNSHAVLSPELKRNYLLQNAVSLFKENFPIPFFSFKLINRKIFGHGSHLSLCRSRLFYR